MDNLLVALPYLVAGSVLLCVALAVYLVLSQVSERASAREALSQLSDYEVQSKRDQQLVQPLTKRALAPALALAGKHGSRFNKPAYVESVKELHLRAGIDSLGVVERFLALRVLLAAAIIPWTLFAISPLMVGSGMVRVGLWALGIAALWVLPKSRLTNRVKEREASIRRALPDTLDLLVICVEAGLGFEQALDRVVVNVPGPLSRELARMMGEVAAGSTRAEALRGLQNRVDIEEIRSFVLSLIQADTFGVSIGRILRGQADDMRIKRRQKAQEKAQKAPVKMMIPMVLCIFPSLFIVLLGPAAINIMESFSGSGTGPN